ncbi:MAG: hypothetical protein JWO36_3153 [Myxococcales bacterium]|nr:hypothetical protein [Myxococcales bacterium]
MKAICRRRWCDVESSSGVTISHSLFANGNADGIQSGVEDNIAYTISVGDGSTAASDTHNMVRLDPSAEDVIGTLTFAAGPGPTTWEGFRLAAGSPGTGTATDGSNVGIRAP